MQPPNTNDPARNYIVIEDTSGHSGMPNMHLVGEIAGVIDGVVIFKTVAEFGNRHAAVNEAKRLKDAWPHRGPAQKPE